MMSSCWQITFRPQQEVDEKFMTFLDEYFEVNAQNYADDGHDEYVGYCSGEFAEAQMLVAAHNSGIVLPPYTIERLESSNWLKDYVIKFAPFETADFCIYGIHETQTPQTDKIPLQIYAATAFGSDHQTTRSCLQAISELHQQGFKPKRILDVGTGSGILSLAAASLWPQAKIIAVDIDEEAVLVTRSNAQNNPFCIFHNQLLPPAGAIRDSRGKTICTSLPAPLPVFTYSFTPGRTSEMAS